MYAADLADEEDVGQASPIYQHHAHEQRKVCPSPNLAGVCPSLKSRKKGVFFIFYVVTLYFFNDQKIK